MKSKKILIPFVTIVLTLVLAACGTLGDAQKAFDAGEYEQAIQIIKDSGEDLSSDEELNALYINSYEKWAETLVESGDYEKAIQIINDSDIELSEQEGISAVYTDAWQKTVDQNLKEKNYYLAYDALEKMVEGSLISEDNAAELYYSIGEGFADAKQFAPSGLAYAKAGDYKDAAKKSDSSWDKGAFRNTISVGEYCALGIKEDGTVASTRNDEVLENDNSNRGRVRQKIKINVDGWKDMVSVITTDYNCAGLTEKGTVKTSETGYYLFTDEDYSLDTKDWKDIVAISMDSQLIAGLDKYGKVHLAGSDSSGLNDAESWSNIVDVTVNDSIIVGIDIFGHAHVINSYTGSETYDPEYYPFEEKEFKDEDIKQFSFHGAYGTYITADGQLKTTINEERADQIDFMMADYSEEDMDIEDFQNFPADKGKGFVQCEAAYMNYVGLRSDGTVKVGGVMKELLEKFGADKWKNIKEVHIGMGYENPAVIGVTSDGSIKLDGFEGGLYIPFHDRIKSWGKLRKPTIEYDTSGIK